jgi:hypothetical protein
MNFFKLVWNRFVCSLKGHRLVGISIDEGETTPTYLIGCWRCQQCHIHPPDSRPAQLLQAGHPRSGSVSSTEPEQPTTSSFVDDLINKFTLPKGTGLGSFSIDGVQIPVATAAYFVEWLLNNRAMLESAGKDVFIDFIGLFNSGKKEEAYQAFLAGGSPTDVLADLLQDGIQLKTDADLRDAFEKAMLDLTLNVVIPIGEQVLIGML